MKVATWNVNSIRIRQQQVVNWLITNPVDVLCLQETKVIDQDFPKTSFEELGYHLYISGQPSYNGVALLSRQPLEDVRIGFTSVLGDSLLTQEFDQQKRVISGILNDVRVVNLYIPNGASFESEKYTYKLSWLKILQDYLVFLKTNFTQELCVCGDFNIAPEDKDIHNPKGKETHIMATPQERKTLQEVLEVGLKDAFRKFTQDGGYYTWWDYRSGGFQRNRGWRIDHHYLTSNLYEQATSCTIDLEPRKQEKPSDHTPVIVEF